MKPILFSIGGVPFYAYGAFLFIGVYAAWCMHKRLIEKADVDSRIALRATLICIPISLIGSKVLYLITQIDYLIASPSMTWTLLTGGGLVFYGAPLVAIVFAFFYLKKHNVPFFRVMDSAGVSFPIGQAFGRIGCLFAGCCHGKPTDAVVGMAFNSPLTDWHLRGVAVHPTQLYEALATGLLAWALYWLYQRRKFEGQVFFAYLISYAVIRSIIEVFRGDMDRRVFFGFVSTSQAISAAVVVVSIAALLYRFRSSAQTQEAVQSHQTPLSVGDET